MKPRIFDDLPADLNPLILSRLPLKDVLKLRLTRKQGRAAIDHYLQGLCHINNIAKLSRADVALLLQNTYNSDSENFKQLQSAALKEDANDATYALYALVANVTELDAVKLLRVINSLREQKCPERILTSLNIIHHYLTHGNDFDGELRQLIEHAGGSYINLRGATLVANFYQLDLSHADLRQTKFNVLVSGASLEGANLTDAEFSDKTIFSKETKAKGMIVEGVKLNGCVIESEEDPVSGKVTYDVPELAPLIQAVIGAAANRKKDGGCNIL